MFFCSFGFMVHLCLQTYIQRFHGNISSYPGQFTLLGAGYNVHMREEASPHVDALEFEKGREACRNFCCFFFFGGGGVGWRGGSEALIMVCWLVVWLVNWLWLLLWRDSLRGKNTVLFWAILDHISTTEKGISRDL